MAEDDIVTPLISLGHHHQSVGGGKIKGGNRHNKSTKQSVSTTLNADDGGANEDGGGVSSRKVSKAKASITSANNPLVMLSKSNSRLTGGEDMALTIMRNILK